MEKETLSYVWKGAIPLQIHLHESEVTSLPPPSPALVLAPRIGYLPLLVPLIKPYFSDSLPPGADTVWFEYKGLPLKWYIPTGVLFDLLCAVPERPWNLTIHFRGYPGDILTPSEGEESVKWTFINSLKEAACIINGNCKNIMGNLDAYTRVSSKLKLGCVEDDYTKRTGLTRLNPTQGLPETDTAGQVKTGRIPVRLYVRSVNEDFDDLVDIPEVNSWDNISYINRPVEILLEEGRCLTMHDAIRSLLPGFFSDQTPTDKQIGKPAGKDKMEASEEITENRSKKDEVEDETVKPSRDPTAEIKFIRIQGIEPKLEIPFSWLVNNLKNPEHFLHMCVFVKTPPQFNDF